MLTASSPDPPLIRPQKSIILIRTHAQNNVLTVEKAQQFSEPGDIRKELGHVHFPIDTVTSLELIDHSDSCLMLWILLHER